MTKAEAFKVLTHIYCIKAETVAECEAVGMAMDALEQPERKEGSWGMKWNCFFHGELPMCSQCLKFSPFKYDYCPHCGADMRKEKSNDES